jgi:hypothetical protein
MNRIDKDIKKEPIVSFVPNLHQISDCRPKNDKTEKTNDSRIEKPAILANKKRNREVNAANDPVYIDQ